MNTMLEASTESYAEAAAVLRGKRVLVTGATGFTGGALAEALAELGAEVRVFARRPQGLAARLQGQVEVACGDVRDRQAVARAVSECDVVYHIAALSRDASTKPQAYWDVNVGGTEAVLEACAEQRVARLVYCSTMGVHGSVRRIPSDERAPLRPGDAYQRSKLVAEQRVWTWHHATGIPTSVVRPAGIYGPGDLRLPAGLDRHRYVGQPVHAGFKQQRHVHHHHSNLTSFSIVFDLLSKFLYDSGMNNPH